MQTSPKAHQRQTVRSRCLNGIGLAKKHLPRRGVLRQGLLIALFVALPGLQPALAFPNGQEGPQRMEFQGAGTLPVGSSLATLSEQKGEDGLSRLIEVFAPVTPKCETVADKHSQQECKQWERSFSQRWEQFRHEHPSFIGLLILSLATFVLGIVVGAAS